MEGRLMCPACRQQLLERLTFDKLFSVSEPKRVLRSKTVRGPPLDVEAKNDGVFYHFNFKSFPSTTGHRHRGYIKFFKPKKQIPLEKVECLVDCACPDFRYRWAWTNKQRGSSVVGPKSLNQAFNRAPRITNPRGKSGLCKHLLALRDFIYGEYENFDGTDADTSAKLDAVVKSVQARSAKLPEKPVAKATAKATEKPTPPPPPAPAPQRVRPSAARVTPQGTSRGLPAAAKAQIQRRFSRTDSVVRGVNELSQAIQEADDVEVNPEASEALELLREIRNSLKILAHEEEPYKQGEPKPDDDDDDKKEGPSPDDLPEPGPEDQVPAE